MRLIRTASLLVVTAFVLTACGGEPALPELTDPTEILQAAATNATAASSVHVDLQADGELRLATGPATTKLSLDDMSASADLDLAEGEARVTFTAPGILNLRGELIVADGTAYVKTSMTGSDYHSLPIGSAAAGGSSVSPAPSLDGESIVSGLARFLATPGLAPVKGADVECGGTTCYSVTIELTADELAGLGLGNLELPVPTNLPVPMPDFGGIATLDLTAEVEKDTRRLAGLTIEAGAADTASATLDLRLSKWDEPVDIEPPPADQVSDGFGGLGG